jgi:hypothetical protein
MRSHPVLAALALVPLAACGAADGDAAIPGCDYVQRDHAALPDVEAVPVPYTGEPFTVCGTIDLLHGTGEVATYTTHQTYTITSTVDADVIASFDSDASLDGFAEPYTFLHAAGGGLVDGDHGAFAAHVWAGGVANQLIVYARYPTTATAPVPYKLTIAPFDARTICAISGAPAAYTEAHDGADSHDNDVFHMVSVEGGYAIEATPSASDVAEPTGLVVAAGSQLRLHGTAAATAKDAVGINDVDAYAIVTGPDTYELSLRLAWEADEYMQFALVPSDPARVDLNAHHVRTGPETEVWAVKPSTAYTLWVMSQSPTATATAVDYDLSVCGAARPPRA